MNQREVIFKQIDDERQRQNNKWGEQNHPVLNPGFALNDRYKNPDEVCAFYGVPTESAARAAVTESVIHGDLTYMDILLEEISEACSCGTDTDHLREELVQCAAVLVAMIESLDRNGR